MGSQYLTSDLCEEDSEDSEGCSQLGGFDPSQSSTYTIIAEDAFDITYVS